MSKSFECFLAERIVAAAAVAVFLNSHLSILVRFHCSVASIIFMGIQNAFVCVWCRKANAILQAVCLSMYSFHSFAGLFVCWARKKKPYLIEFSGKKKKKIVMKNHRKAHADCLRIRKKNTDTRQRWHRQRQRCKEKKKQFSSFFPVTFFTSTIKCIERYTHKMLMVYGPCTYRVPFFSQFNLCPCMHGKGNKRQRQTESSKRIHFYM